MPHLRQREDGRIAPATIMAYVRSVVGVGGPRPDKIGISHGFTRFWTPPLWRHRGDMVRFCLSVRILESARMLVQRVRQVLNLDSGNVPELDLRAGDAGNAYESRKTFYR